MVHGFHIYLISPWAVTSHRRRSLGESKGEGKRLKGSYFAPGSLKKKKIALSKQRDLNVMHRRAQAPNHPDINLLKFSQMLPICRFFISQVHKDMSTLRYRHCGWLHFTLLSTGMRRQDAQCHPNLWTWKTPGNPGGTLFISELCLVTCPEMPQFYGTEHFTITFMPKLNCNTESRHSSMT